MPIFPSKAKMLPRHNHNNVFLGRVMDAMLAQLIDRGWLVKQPAVIRISKNAILFRQFK